MSEAEIQTIEDVLLTKGQYVGPTAGVSMLPMLKNRRDTIVVSKKTERLKPLEVALYKRGEQYILHRVLEVTDTGYIIRGDNCYSDEIVPEEAVIGVLTEFFRKNKHVICESDKKYHRYVKNRLKTYKSRRFFVQAQAKCKRFIKKILGLFGYKKGKQ